MKRIDLQPDDIRLFQLLAGPFLLLNRRQIAALFPRRSDEALPKRLEKLVSAGYLCRRSPQDPFHESELPHYYLGPEAEKAIASEIPGERLRSHRSDARTLSDIALPHLRFASWLHIKFLTAPRDYLDYRLEAWIPQYSPFWSVLNRQGLSAQPDGYARYRVGGAAYDAFLEADRSTYRGDPLKRKLHAYHRYAQSGLAQAHFSARAFRVLFITETPARAESLLRSFSRYPPSLFWVSLRDDFFSRPLFSPCWRSWPSDVLHSLEEPPFEAPEPPPEDREPRDRRPSGSPTPSPPHLTSSDTPLDPSELPQTLRGTLSYASSILGAFPPRGAPFLLAYSPPHARGRI